MITILIWGTALTLLVGCGSAEEDGTAGPRIAATTGILADITRQVAGPGLTVEQLVPNGSSPHDFAFSAEDRLRLEQAELVVANGAGLEAALPLDDVDTPRWQLADHVGPLLPIAEETADPAFDPHVWMDPARVATALPSLADALGEVDPAHAGDYRARARDYARRLRELDAEMRRTLGRVPPSNRELVTSHDALGYFADGFGFEVVATTFPISGPEAEASAAALEEVIDRVRSRDVPAVFAGEEDDPEALELVAEETGVEVVDDLIVESIGSVGSYEEMLRHDASAIAEPLGSGE